jgi:hypothetical protein
VRVATEPVCRNHTAPIELLRQRVITRPPLVLWQGPRGGGKSFLQGLGSWINSLQYDGHAAMVLGGSLAQSRQIYASLKYFRAQHPQRSPVKLTATQATFVTGSTLAILAASETSVRGPHVPTLLLDEVDLIAAERRDSAMGMSMGLHGLTASVVMTSTWHIPGGPMAGLMEQGRSGAFPVHTFCIWEVLERCPDTRSGPKLENCPACPLVTWCHDDRHERPDRLPKAKRSDGHYPIESLIQKVRAVTPRVFRSDYLCDEPIAPGAWFASFGNRNISTEADYDPRLAVHVSIDSGVYTGAVFMQVRTLADGSPLVTVYDEMLTYDVYAFEVAQAILRRAPAHVRRRVSTDSSGGVRNPVGPTVIDEYRRAGLNGHNGIEHWRKPAGSVVDTLALLESFVGAADGTPSLLVHPRCVKLLDAFRSYARAQLRGQWQDYPEDPQHPHEDMIDALRGGLSLEFPEGRRPPPQFNRLYAGRIF